jgi:hypothetical protein
LWALLANQTDKATVGVGGSLHSYPPPASGNYAFYLPDTFAPTPEAFPPELEAFQAFNLAMVSKSARNVDTGIDLGQAKKLLPYISRLGITPRTVAAISNQIVSERFDKKKKLRRRTLQSVLAFDGFMAQLNRTRPSFATFFTNHVASSMHRFWGAMYPGDFEQFGYDEEWVQSFGTEISAAMLEADYMIGVLKKFVEKNPEYMLVVTSSMGQAAHIGDPYLSELTIKDVDRFMGVMGVPAGGWKRRPAMMPDYSFFIDAEHRALFLARLSRATVGRKQQAIEYEERENGFIHVSLGMPNMEEGSDMLQIGNESVPLSAAGLTPLETDFQQGSTGYHIPQGILVAYDPVRSGQTNNQEIAITDIAPSIMRKLGTAPPSYMSSASIFN